MTNDMDHAFTCTLETRRLGTVVLGMHRSGTSALAGLLVKLGAAPPKTLLGANAGNPRGHWESASLIRFHNELLASAGSRWDDWRAFPAEWYSGPFCPAFKTRARQIFETEFAGAPDFVLKDPRVCRFLKFWLEIFDEAGMDVQILLPLRSPLEVAQSHRTRDGFSLAKGLLLWLRHVLDAEVASRNCRRFFLEYDALLADWRGVLARANAEAGIVFPRYDDMNVAAADAFLDSGMKRERSDSASHSGNWELQWWIFETFDALVRLSRSEPTAQVFERLDRLRSNFDAGSALFGDYLMPIEAQQANLELTLSAERQQYGRLETSYRDLAARHADLKARHSGLFDGHEASKIPYGDLEKTVSELRTQLEAEQAARSFEAQRHAAELQAERISGERTHSIVREAYLSAFEVETALINKELAVEISRRREIESSFTWTASAPLRALVGKFRARKS